VLDPQPDIPPGDPRVDAWDPWRPDEVARLLAGVATPWWVAGGWALDLWLGTQTRPHEDIEICVPRSDWPEVRERLVGRDLWYATGDGGLRHLAPAAAVPDRHRQVWVRDREAGTWRLDVMLEAGGRDEWVCHRDPSVRRPLGEAVAVTPDGIPYQRPEIVLLLKAKRVRAKDEADLAAGLPGLDPTARRWLADTLTILHPGHPWLARVAPAPS
jgi:Aminoglycoside-2''-adenylyltransferase